MGCFIGLIGVRIWFITGKISRLFDYSDGWSRAENFCSPDRRRLEPSTQKQQERPGWISICTWEGSRMWGRSCCSLKPNSWKIVQGGVRNLDCLKIGFGFLTDWGTRSLASRINTSRGVCLLTRSGTGRRMRSASILKLRFSSWWGPARGSNTDEPLGEASKSRMTMIWSETPHRPTNTFAWDWKGNNFITSFKRVIFYGREPWVWNVESQLRIKTSTKREASKRRHSWLWTRGF